MPHPVRGAHWRAGLHHLHSVATFWQKPNDELGAGSDPRRVRAHGRAEEQSLATELPNRKSLHNAAVAPGERAVATRDAHCAACFECFILGDRQRVWMAAVADRTPAVRKRSVTRKLQIGRLGI